VSAFPLPLTPRPSLAPAEKDLATRF
jgi:hypothetical protein